MAHGVTMIWSTRSGDGKTLLAWELVAAIAKGRKVWGRAVAGPRRVLVVDYENSAGVDLLPRLRDMGYVEAADMAGVAIVEHAGAKLPPLDTPEGGRALIEMVEAHRAEVVVIDTGSSGRGRRGERLRYVALIRQAHGGPAQGPRGDPHPLGPIGQGCHSGSAGEPLQDGRSRPRLAALGRE